MEGIYFGLLMIDFFWCLTSLMGTYLLLKLVSIITKSIFLRQRATRILISILVMVVAGMFFVYKNHAALFLTNFRLPFLLSSFFTIFIFVLKAKNDKIKV